MPVYYCIYSCDYFQVFSIQNNASVLELFSTILWTLVAEVPDLLDALLIGSQLLDQFHNILFRFFLSINDTLGLVHLLFVGLHLLCHVFLLALVVSAEVLLPNRDQRGVKLHGCSELAISMHLVPEYVIISIIFNVKHRQKLDVLSWLSFISYRVHAYDWGGEFIKLVCVAIEGKMS